MILDLLGRTMIPSLAWQRIFDSVSRADDDNYGNYYYGCDDSLTSNDGRNQVRTVFLSYSQSLTVHEELCRKKKKISE